MLGAFGRVDFDSGLLRILRWLRERTDLFMAFLSVAKGEKSRHNDRIIWDQHGFMRTDMLGTLIPRFIHARVNHIGIAGTCREECTNSQ